MGYIEPGHGWKGKQRWLNTDTDLEELYMTYKEKKKYVLLLCHLPSEKTRKKSATNQATNEPQSKRSQAILSNDEKTTEANKVFKDLSEKHESRYTPEQLHAWAYLIQLKKHSDPPDYPYFRGYKQRKDKDQSSHLSCKERTVEHANVISPQKKVIMRTQCIDQLQKISDLLDKGCISQDQYKELQDTIMKDITTL